MKWKNKGYIYLFNFLFLFYTTIGPAKALYCYLIDFSDTPHLANLQHIVKVRFDKKYINKEKGSIVSTNKADSKLYKKNYFFIYIQFEKYLVAHSETKLYLKQFEFLTIPIQILYLKLRL